MITTRIKGLNYAELSRLLTEYGWTQAISPEGRTYRHEAGARLLFPPPTDDEQVISYLLVMVRTAFSDYGILSYSAFDMRILPYLVLMSKHVYISCLFGERELEPVKSLCRFLREANCSIHFGWGVEHPGYRVIETAIESADVFVAIVAEGYYNSSGLNHELHYALALNRARLSHRPRIFGLQVSGYVLPRISENIPLEWLDEGDFELLLVDLPELI